MEVCANIRRLRLVRKLTQQQVADVLGIDRSVLARYEKGVYDLRPQLLLQLAELFGVQPNDLFGLPPNAEIAQTEVPVLGRIAAGKLDFSEQAIEGYELVPSERVRGGKFFYLRVSGDCMAPQIPDGSLALVRIQPEVEDGEIAVVTANGDEATLKRVYTIGNQTLLKADNPATPPIIVMRFADLRIVGKVVAVTIKTK